MVHVTDILNDGGGGAAATTAATAGTSSSASASAATETATTSSGSVSAESSSGPVAASDDTNASSASASASASANSSSYIASAAVDGDGGDDSMRALSPRSALQPSTPNSGTGTGTVPGPVPVPASVESPAPRPSILRFAHQALPGNAIDCCFSCRVYLAQHVGHIYSTRLHSSPSFSHRLFSFHLILPHLISSCLLIFVALHLYQVRGTATQRLTRL